MATDPKDTTVDLQDEDIVTVDITDKPELAEAEVEATEATAAAPEPKAPLPRVRLDEPAEPAEEPSAAEDAATRIAESLRKVEEERRLREAAEATARAERAAREAAEASARARAQETQDALAQADQYQLNLITNGIEAATSQLEAAKADLTRAYEAGEFSKATEAQVAISTATAQLSRLQEAKSNFEAQTQNRRPATFEGRAQQQQPQATNQFDAFVGQFAPESQAWLRAHPECLPPALGGNALAHSRMLHGHHEAEAAGLRPNTPEYFAKIEEFVGGKAAQPAAERPVPGAAHTRTPPRKAPVAAPVSREPPGANGVPRSTRQVTLTKEQQEAAINSFPHLEKRQAFAVYARNLLELEAEGKLGRTTH